MICAAPNCNGWNRPGFRACAGERMGRVAKDVGSLYRGRQVAAFLGMTSTDRAGRLESGRHRHAWES